MPLIFRLAGFFLVLCTKANNIAKCADGHSNVESYGCIWTWDDDDDDDNHNNKIDTDETTGNHHSRAGGVGLGNERPRLPHNRRLENNKVSASLWSTLFMSPPNCCGSSVAGGTTHSDDDTDDASQVAAH